jgi:hypothetical protein
MPESYLKVAATIALPRKSIGHLELATGGRREGSLLDFLSKANGPAFPLWPLVALGRFYFVAAYQRHLVCVRQDGAERAGEVFMIMLSKPPSLSIMPVAFSFEQLLIGFGRIREKWRTNQLGEAAIEAFLNSLSRDLGFQSDQMQTWSFIGYHELWDPGTDGSQEAIVQEELARDETEEPEYIFPDTRRPIPVGLFHLKFAQALGLVEQGDDQSNRANGSFRANLGQFVNRGG